MFFLLRVIEYYNANLDSLLTLVSNNLDSNKMHHLPKKVLKDKISIEFADLEYKNSVIFEAACNNNLIIMRLEISDFVVTKTN